jgi:hypothetical protein
MPNETRKTSDRYAHLRLRVEPPRRKKEFDLARAYESLLTAYVRLERKRKKE